MKQLLLFILIIADSYLLQAQKKTLGITEQISSAADKIEAKCISWRRDIHQNPELGNNEFRTAKLIATITDRSAPTTSG